MNWVIIDSSNSLSPVLYQAITWFKVDLSIEIQWTWNQNTKLLFQENLFENVVCIISAFCSGLFVITAWATSNRPNSQIPQCTCLTSHNAPLWNRNVQISVPKWCIVGCGTGTLWDLFVRAKSGQSVGVLSWVDKNGKQLWLRRYIFLTVHVTGIPWNWRGALSLTGDVLLCFSTANYAASVAPGDRAATYMHIA